MSFNNNIFINCPFDDQYYPLLRPLLFTVIYLGFVPRIALERLDSGQPRIQKILSLIEQSKYAIHDLSRIQARRRGEYFRLNMPFELGIDIGCRLFGNGKHSNKRCLVLEAKKFRYQIAISDLSSSDIAVHNNAPEEVVSVVRNWLNTEARLSAPGPAKIWGAFIDFMTDNYEVLKARGYSKKNIDHLPVNELVACMQQWTSRNTR